VSKSVFSQHDLNRVLVQRIGLPENDLPEDADTPFADLGLDSLAMVELQRALEQDYGFEITDADACAMRTVRDALAYVNGRLAATELI
jgi:act minimal PKS acyl carrier protein